MVDDDPLIVLLAEPVVLVLPIVDDEPVPIVPVDGIVLELPEPSVPLLDVPEPNVLPVEVPVLDAPEFWEPDEPNVGLELPLVLEEFPPIPLVDDVPLVPFDRVPEPELEDGFEIDDEPEGFVVADDELEGEDWADEELDKVEDGSPELVDD